MDVRFVAHCGLKSDIAGGPKSAKSDRGTCSGKTNSLDPGLSICLTIAET